MAREQLPDANRYSVSVNDPVVSEARTELADRLRRMGIPNDLKISRDGQTVLTAWSITQARPRTSPRIREESLNARQPAQ